MSFVIFIQILWQIWFEVYDHFCVTWSPCSFCVN